VKQRFQDLDSSVDFALSLLDGHNLSFLPSHRHFSPTLHPFGSPSSKSDLQPSHVTMLISNATYEMLAKWSDRIIADDKTS